MSSRVIEVDKCLIRSEMEIDEYHSALQYAKFGVTLVGAIGGAATGYMLSDFALSNMDFLQDVGGLTELIIKASATLTGGAGFAGTTLYGLNKLEDAAEWREHYINVGSKLRGND